MTFVPLHVKSEYSIGLGTAPVRDIVARAGEFGYRSLALTDLENLYGQVLFHRECRLKGIRPITGVELRAGFMNPRNPGSRSGRVVLLALDEQGYGNLCRIVSERRLRPGIRSGMASSGHLYLPSPEHSDGVFALSDCPDMVRRLAKSLFPRDRLGLLLVRPDHPVKDSERRNAASELRVPLIADLDVVFPRPENYDLHLLQVAVRRGFRLRDHSIAARGEGPERWLRRPDLAARLFADAPAALAATAEIAERCCFGFETLEARNRTVALAHEDRAAAELAKLCAAAVRTRGRKWTPAHRSRLRLELETFRQVAFSGVMVSVAEILGHCRRSGIPAIARGSAVSSLTLHALGGSTVNPLEYGLLFERFLHSRKSSWPDIDLDIPWHLRDELIEWVYDRFGRDRVAMVAAMNRFGRRSALREGMKAWGAKPQLIRLLSGRLPPEDLPVEEFDFIGLASENDRETDPVYAGADREVLHGELPRALELVSRLVGRPAHVGVHPGGVVITPEPLDRIVPLELAAKGVVMSQYDLSAVAGLGLVKIDLLGNRCLSELQETFALAGEAGLLLPESIPLDDPTTIALIDRGDTLGCFQLESPAMRALLTPLPIRGFRDVIAALALIRPGPAAGEVKSLFVSRAQAGQACDSTFEFMSGRLRETYGLFLYEEDIMLLLAGTAGLTLGEADELRRAIIESGGDRDFLSALESGFLRKGMTSGAPREHLRAAWRTAARFAAYSFNKAHASSYAFLAYLSAYAKVHHPAEFACSLLNHHQGLYPLRTLAGEFGRMGVVVRPPDVNRSFRDSRCDEDCSGKIRLGLGRIKGLTAAGLRRILDERHGRGGFETLSGFVERTRLTLGEIRGLILSGACDGLHPLSPDNYPFAHEAALELLKKARSLRELDRLRIPRPLKSDEGEEVSMYRALVRVRNELHYLGMHVKSHPMLLLRNEAGRYGCIDLGSAKELSEGDPVRVAAVVAAMKRAPATGGVIAFITLEDETGLLEALLLPAAFERFGGEITTPGPYFADGKLKQRMGLKYLEITGLVPFHRRLRPFE